jgi:hypothetical protein
MGGYRQWSLPAAANIPNSDKIPKQLDRWTQTLNLWTKANNEGKEVIVMMDDNLDSSSWSDNFASADKYTKEIIELHQALHDTILSTGTTTMNNQITRQQRGAKPSCLDHCYSNTPNKMAEVLTKWKGGSDHAMLLAHYSYATRTQLPGFLITRNRAQLTPAKINNMLSESQDLKNILNEQDPNKIANTLTKILTEIVNKLAPTRKIQVKKNYCPYITKSTLKMMDERAKAQTIARQTNNIDDWRQYRSLRNSVNRQIKQDKSKWFSDQLSKEPQNTKRTWNITKQLAGFSSRGAPKTLTINGTNTSSTKEMAKEINKFFI